MLELGASTKSKEKKEGPKQATLFTMLPKAEKRKNMEDSDPNWEETQSC